MTPLEHALAYAQLGWRLAPIPPTFKYPHKVDNWQQKATADPDKIRKHWGTHPDHGICVPTGPGSGIVAIDIDSYKGGDEGWAELEALHGPAPETVEAITGGGGRHLLFRHPIDGPVITNAAAAHLPAGIDVRGDGGQICIAPTIHPSGTPYAWEVEHDPLDGYPIADLPTWLLELLTRPPVAQEARREVAPYAGGDSIVDLFAANHTWPQLLEADGWTFHSRRSDCEMWTRPGKNARAGASATLYYKGSDVLKVFTASPPAGLAENGTYTRFGYYMFTRHGGDAEAAGRAYRCEINGTTGPSYPDGVVGQGGMAKHDPAGPPDEAGAAPPAPAKKASKATDLVNLALERYRLGRDDEGRAFAVANAGPNIARLVDRGGLGEELAAVYFAEHGSAVSGSAVNDALGILRGHTTQAERESLALRVAKLDDGIVLDLGTPDGRAVIIQPGGWTVVATSPVVFRRTSLTMALPEPVHGGTLDGLRSMLNVSNAAWPLFVGWLVATLVLHDGSRPILFLNGEQGTGKTSVARCIAQLVDPSPAPVRAAPKDVESWVVSAAASMVVALDNLSTVPEWLADALCRAATGEGLVRRALYTDNEVAVTVYRRAVVLTTIDAGALRGDLGERLVPVELSVIPSDHRRTDRDLDAAFRNLHATALGAVLDLTSAVLSALPDVELGRMPRMADFARVLAALDNVIPGGWPPVAPSPTGEVVPPTALGRYLDSIDDVAREVFESDPLAVAIRDAALSKMGFNGTASELLTLLQRPDSAAGWPKTAKGLSGAVRRLAPALRSMGVAVDWTRSNGTRWLRISPFESAASAASDGPYSVNLQEEGPSGQDGPQRDEESEGIQQSLAALAALFQGEEPF